MGQFHVLFVFNKLLQPLFKQVTAKMAVKSANIDINVFESVFN